MAVGSMHVHAYHYVGMKFVAHSLHRKILVNAAVVKQGVVDGNWAEHYRKGHRRAYGVAYLSGREHFLVAALHIGRHASERNHELVEVAVTPCGGWREYLDELIVHGHW